LDREGLFGFQNLAVKLESLDLGQNNLSIRDIKEKIGIGNYSELELNLRKILVEERTSPSVIDDEISETSSYRSSLNDEVAEEVSNSSTTFYVSER
jgi:hypothetical protein